MQVHRTGLLRRLHRPAYYSANGSVHDRRTSIRKFAS
jgi:hypothetical protein